MVARGVGGGAGHRRRALWEDRTGQRIADHGYAGAIVACLRRWEVHNRAALAQIGRHGHFRRTRNHRRRSVSHRDRKGALALVARGVGGRTSHRRRANREGGAGRRRADHLRRRVAVIGRRGAEADRGAALAGDRRAR